MKIDNLCLTGDGDRERQRLFFPVSYAPRQAHRRTHPQSMNVSDCVIRIAGEGGEGVISCGEILTRGIARTGYQVMSWKTFPSEIRGGLARYQFRVGCQPVLSMGSSVDVLVTFNQEAMDDCCGDVTCTACIVLYDPETVKEIGCNAVAGSRYAIPFNKICKETTGSLRAKNVVALGATARLLNLDFDICKQLIVDTWGSKGPAVVEMNHKALQAGYDAAEEEFNPTDLIDIPRPEVLSRRLLMMSGNDAIALGAIAAGCRFVSGYPITPATSIFERLCAQLPRFGGHTVQTEDEMAALAAAIGASFAGVKSMTATSGPGIALMSELINLDSMLELPMVIVNVQRGGPSTGLPTKTEQSDLNFAVYGTPGDAPRIVIAPASIEDCYYQTIRAFNLAEKYQMPVIIMTDASLAFRKQTVFEPDLGAVERVDRNAPSKTDLDKGSYLRYIDTATGVSPIASPGTRGGAHIVSSLEHVESGAPDYSPAVHVKMMDKRQRKLESAEKELSTPEGGMRVVSGARVGIISWGSTHGAIREALTELDKEGERISHFHPRVIWPLPARQLRQFMAPLNHVIVIEENYSGQLANLLRSRLLAKPTSVTKCEGVPFTSEDVYKAVRENLDRVK